MIVCPEIITEAKPNKIYTISATFGIFDLMATAVTRFAEKSRIKVGDEVRFFDPEQVRKFGNELLSRVRRLTTGYSAYALNTEYTHRLQVNGQERMMAGAGLAGLAAYLHTEMQESQSPELAFKATVAEWGAADLLPGVELPCALIQGQE